MYTLPAHHGTVSLARDSSAAGACLTKAIPCGAVDVPSVYNGHLGVLRHEQPNLERQRRYDFWPKRA